MSKLAVMRTDNENLDKGLGKRHSSLEHHLKGFRGVVSCDEAAHFSRVVGGCFPCGALEKCEASLFGGIEN